MASYRNTQGCTVACVGFCISLFSLILKTWLPADVLFLLGLALMMIGLVTHAFSGLRS